MQQQPNPNKPASPILISGADLPAALIMSGLYLIVALPAYWLASSPVQATIWTSILLGATLVTLSIIDLKTHRLPDLLTMPLLAAGLGFCFILEWDDVRWRIAAAAAAYATFSSIAWLYHRFRGRHGLGLGDAKLLAASGAWVGIDGLPMTLLIASLSALTAILAATLAGHRFAASTRIPFGPFLAAGTWFVWHYGSSI